MEEQAIHQKNKGGRPPKEIKRACMITLKCSAVEREIITGKAKGCGLTVSRYLREMGLNGRIDNCKKVLPEEVLRHKGTWNHIAANLNQLAKKRNGVHALPALERIKVQEAVNEIKALAAATQNYLK